jgi:hypothetical protein
VKRTTATDWAYAADYTFMQHQFRRLLGITERENVRSVDISGNSIVLRILHKGEMVHYETTQQEFKKLLGITDPENVLIVYASVWSSKVQISMVTP